MQQDDIENPKNLTKEQLEAEKKADEDYVKKLEVAQYKIRAKPELYTKEIQQYSEDFKSFFSTVKESPLLKNKKFAELAVFLARVNIFFKTDLAYLQDYIQEFMEHYANQMNPFLRKKMVSAYMIMRAQNLILPYKALTFMFKLFAVPDKELRKMVSAHIINDLKRMNKHHKNEKINKQIQNFIFDILKKNSDILAKRSLQLMISMYKKCIWNDVKTVNIIAQGCFNDYYKVRLTAAHFLIETTEKINDIDTSDSEDEGEQVNPREKIGSKKTKARQQRLEREKRKAQKKQRKKLQNTIKNSFFPIDQIYNPQEFVERLFHELKKRNDRFASKLVVLQLIARMINRHKLMLMSFYSYLQKYLFPHQKEISKILSFLAEAVHDLISYEDLAPIMKHIVDNFVNQRCSEQDMTMGLNTIREMCNKNIFILDQFTVNYLADYYGYKNRNVSKAAKSIINLYREKNPRILEKKYRGRYNREQKDIPMTEDEVIPIYKMEKPMEAIPGADLIDEGGEIPIYFDKIMTDEDFRKIKFLQEKQRLQELQRQKEGDSEEGEEGEEELEFGTSEEIDSEEGEEGEEGEEEEDDGEEIEIDEDEIEGEEGEEESEISDLEFDEEGEEGEEIEWASEDEDEEEQQQQKGNDVNEEDQKVEKELKQQQKKVSKEMGEEEKSKALKEENKRRRIKELEKDLEDYDEFQSDEEDVVNPHGFISEDVIKAFRKKKSERREEERNRKLQEKLTEKKHTHHRKEKKGGETNQQKLKNKPLMMVMDKKHKQKKKAEGKLNIKSKIKQIKNQLGHVRSTKQFQRKKLKRKQ